MDNEINDLIKFITESQKKKELKSVFKQGKWEEFFTKSTLLTGVAAVVIVIVDFSKIISLASVITFLSFAILFISTGVISIRRSIIHPLDEYFESFAERMKLRDQYLDELSNYSEQAILSLKKGIKNDISNFQVRSSFLVGSIEKVGLFPAFIAVFIAYLQLSEKTSFDFSNLLIALIVGMYLGVFMLQRLSNILQTQISLLDDALEYKKEKPETK